MDHDCEPDWAEGWIVSDPTNKDSDEDGATDGNCGSEDLNANGIVDAGETDPTDPDTDSDGVFDGTEMGLTQPESPDTVIAAGNFVADNDPGTTTSAADADTDDDGIIDGYEDANAGHA